MRTMRGLVTNQRIDLSKISIGNVIVVDIKCR